ncbi:MAG: efflux transporter outer membrane subunit [Chlamydiae bacterium]|nr:efflux transporter outer membrane subunit [Chlamydiota bacterium]
MKRYIALSLVLLQSCSMAPKYERTTVAMPNKWRIETSDIGNISNTNWWAQFGDQVLNDYIQEALENNQDLKVAIANVDQFIAQLQIARSGFFPQFNANVSGNNQQISNTQQPFLPGLSSISQLPQFADISVPSRFNTFNLVLNGSYYLDFWGLIRSASDAALAELLSSIDSRRAVVLTLITAVASTYIDILQIDREINVLKKTIETREESLRLARVRFELGITSEMPVEQAISELEEATIRLYRLQIDQAFAEDQMINLLGKTTGPVKRGKTLEQIHLPLSVPTYLPSDLLNNRPDILAAEQKLIAANANIGVARANFFPQINLAATLGTDSSQIKNLFNSASSVWQYGAAILQEIFTGGQLTGNLKLAKAQKEMLLHEYQSTILNAVKEVNNALIAHKISLEQIEVQKAHVQTQKQYFHLAKLQYEDGLTDYLTFLDAERRLLTALLEYASAQGYSYTTLINIYKALGGGWVITADSSVNKDELNN